MKKYQKLVEFIVQNVGDKENILSVTHCMTRLRFTLKEDKKVNEKELLTSSEIMTAQYAGGRFQVVVGTHVADVFQELQDFIGNQNELFEEKKKGINGLIEIITKVITPILGILTASGLLQGILAILTVTNVLNTNDGAYIVLHAMGQTAFYFLPVVLGYTSAKAFKLNPFVGMMLGASLIIPELLSNLTTEEALYTLFQGTIFETPVYKTFFGIPMLFPANGYQYTVIPIILITYVGSKVDRLLKHIIPDLLAHNLNAFLTILITVPLSILAIGPITNVLSAIIGATVSGLYTISPMITSVVVALLYQPLVIFGLHWPISAIGISNLAMHGSDYIFPMSFTANFAQTAVVLAIFLRTKSKQQKALAIPAMVSGIFCIIEPAIYGFSLPIKKRFAFSMIGGAVGSIIIAIFSARMYTFSFGVLGFVSFIDPKTGSMSGLFVAIIATIATSVVAFLLTYLTFKKEDDIEDQEKSKLIITEDIVSPMKGTLLAIEQCNDKTFASGKVGMGIVIHPDEDEVYSPITGIVETVFPTGHAIGIISDSGIEVLVHIGVDTVELQGKGFQLHVEKGQKVKQGDILASVDLKSIEKAGYSTETIVVITNTKNYLDIIPEQKDHINVGEKILTVMPFRNTKNQEVFLEEELYER
ncbi:beta-glucoside-specific PTS transporter subunit IIABC [Amedibacillus sp. YH-ame6]